MKGNSLIIGMFLSALFFVQCGGESENAEEGEGILTEEEQKDLDLQLDHIKMLNAELTSGEVKNEIVIATALFEASSKFVNTHPDHEKTPAIMELAAKSSEIMGKPQQAINIMQKLIDEFPETEDTPKYMANIARLYEAKGDVGKAQETYTQLIEKYPETPFAIDAKNYMDNILGKSDAEILMFIDSVNASN